jgi:hypothetical protein
MFFTSCHVVMTFEINGGLSLPQDFNNTAGQYAKNICSYIVYYLTEKRSKLTKGLTMLQYEWIRNACLPEFGS